MMPYNDNSGWSFPHTDVKFPMRFMKYKVPDFSDRALSSITERARLDYPHAHTEVLVDRRDKKISIQLPPYHLSPYLKFKPKDDFDHKIRIANEMLGTYLRSEDGRKLNMETVPGGHFENAEIKTDKNVLIAQNYPDYFKDLNRRDLSNDSNEIRSFVRSMEYLPKTNRIEINIDQCEYTFKEYVIEPPTCAEIRFETRQRIKSNLTIITPSRTRLITSVPKNEQVAIETLREMITEKEFRKYIKDGFILVKGRSGRVYQIFRTRYHTKVWDNGVLVEEVCVRLKDRKIPPTDNVTAFKVLIETDENEFKKLGNVYKMNTSIAA